MTSEPTANTTKDLVVVLPGIMGSTLRRGDDHVWGTGLPTVLSTIATRLRTIKPNDPDLDYQDDVWADGLISAVSR